MRNKDEFKKLVYQKCDEKRAKQRQQQRYRSIALSLAACLILCCAVTLKAVIKDNYDGNEFDRYTNYISVSVNKPRSHYGPDSTLAPDVNPAPPVLDDSATPTPLPFFFSKADDAIEFLISSLEKEFKFDSPNGNTYSDKFDENCYQITIWRDDGAKVYYKFYSKSGQLYVNESLVKISTQQKQEIFSLLQKNG